MKLNEYFENTGIKKKWFADQIGMNPNYLYQVCSGNASISKKHFKKIVEMTGGKVTLEELLNESNEVYLKRVASKIYDKKE